jgi:hypothetical protein
MEQNDYSNDEFADAANHPDLGSPDTSGASAWTGGTIDPIRHAPTAWSVASMIEAAPGSMMIREMLMNGLEAAQRTATPTRRGKVTFDAIEVPAASGPVRKLRVRNTGPGMDAAEMRSCMQLHASGGGKTNGGDQNFGVGAKCTGLKNNPAGLRYRSCKNGRVHETTVCRMGQDYGLLHRPDGKGGSAAVIEVTHEYSAAEVAEDWTEVVLYGEDMEHDTTKQPYKKGRDEPSNWIAAAVNRRFHVFVPNIDVEIKENLDLSKHPQGRVLRGAHETVRRSAGAKFARVALKPGVEAEFAVLEKEGQNRYALTGQCALVRRGEMFDCKFGSESWGRVAARYGVTYGHQQVVIHIILAEDESIAPDRYRQRLERKDIARTEVTTDDYSALIAANLPDFVRAHIEACKPSGVEDSKSLQDRLKRLVAEYDWRRGVLKADPNGTEVTGADTDRDGGKGKGGKKARAANHSTLPGTRPASDTGRSKLGLLPTVTKDHYGTRRSKGLLSGLAAQYDAKIHQIKINLDYEGLEAAVAKVVEAFPHALDADALRHDALLECREEYVFRACKAVMHAFMHEDDAGWDAAAIEKALKEQALTVYLDDVREVSQRVLVQLKKKWGAATS